MVRRRPCEVCKRRPGRSKKISFHKRKEYLVLQCRIREGRKLTTNPRICSDHFDPVDIGIKSNGCRYIKPGATPRWHDTEFIKPSPSRNAMSEESCTDGVICNDCIGEGTVELENIEIKEEPLYDDIDVEYHSPMAENEHCWFINTDHSYSKKAKLKDGSFPNSDSESSLLDNNNSSTASVEVKKEVLEIEAEFQIFGQQVADHLKVLRLENAHKAQLKIQAILKEFDLAEISN